MASMFPQFGATAESLSKASSLVLRIGTDAHLYDDPDDASIAPLLDSRFDSDKSEALKRLLALIAQGADVSHFFPQVVKNVASPSLEVKKLVYLYLLHYAEKRPNEALLSINCFQKDLSDTNPLVRALALRTMAGIRLHVVAPLVLVAVGKCTRDPSAYVRKCAANALPKLSDLRQEENASSLEELVGVMLSDHSPMVVGAAAAALNCVCPNNLLLIGKNFRRLCETLLDVEEWGQVALIDVLLRYVVARHGLVRESIMFASSCTVSSESEKDSCSDSLECDDSHVSPPSDAKLNALMFKCYMEGQEEFLSQPGLANGDGHQSEKAVSTSCKNEDVKLLLQCTSPLLRSQNCAVVLAAAGVHWIMAPRHDVERIVKPLLFLLRSSQASKYVILCNIQAFAKVLPTIFAPYFEDFFICSSDSYHVRALKLDILSTIATDSSAPIIFEEFQDYIVDPDRQFVADTVAAIGLCAQRLPSMANACLEGLLALTVQESSLCNGDHMNHEPAIVVQAIMSIKAIIKLNPATHEKVIVRLVRFLDAIKEPVARALIVWIVGEYNSVGELIPKVVPTVLSYLAWSFISEEVETKLQILNTAAKIAVSGHKGEQQMFRKNLSYVLELAKYDFNYDVRDRARTIEKLVECYISPDNDDGNTGLTPKNGIIHEFVEQILSGKLQTTYPSVNNSRFYLPGSLSQIVLHTAPGYGPLPKPCSLLDSYHHLGMRKGKTALSSSGSSIEENDSDYDSEHSYLSSNASEGIASKSDGSNDDSQSSLSGQHNPPNETKVPLVHISDVGINNNPSALGNTSPSSFSTDLTELMSNSALESWLGEQPSSSSAQNSFNLASARISVNDLHYIVKPKVRTLLDPVNGNGLKLEYTFASEVSPLSPFLVCIEVHFENCCAESLKGISVKDEDSDASIDSACQISETSERLSTARDVPTLVPMDEIPSLDPGETVKRVLQVCFQHHLLPLKLTVLCNNKKHSIKLWPDIGYFMRPLTMNMEAFLHKESQLPGMFECIKRCTFRDHIEEDVEHEGQQHPAHCNDKFLVVARSLASKVLSNAHVHLVNVDMPVSSDMDNASGLCLRFSGEILSSSKPCLITITADGKFSGPLEIAVKVNCEESIFGLNLLNRVAAFLQ